MIMSKEPPKMKEGAYVAISWACIELHGTDGGADEGCASGYSSGSDKGSGRCEERLKKHFPSLFIDLGPRSMVQ